MPLVDKLRETMLKNGPKALSDSELLAIILRTGNKRENVINVANRLFSKYNVKSLSRISIGSLKKELGIGEAKACQIIACFELGRRLARFKEDKKLVIKNAKDIAKVFIPEMSSLKKEHFKGIYLDSRKKIIKEETIFIGSLNESVIHPREIFQIALNENAAALILIHNHPSGNPKPSKEDIEITKKLIEAGDILGIPVLDHIIIGDKKYFSMREKGLI